VFWTALLGFFLLSAAWAMITPYDGAYDEHDHVVRAAGVVRGQLLVRPADDTNGRYQDVPRSLIPANFACLRTGEETARCLGDPPRGHGWERVQTRAGHYLPVYYAVVGWPLAAFPTMTGVVLARLVSALLGAALLALAVVTVWPQRRHRMLLLALLVGVTPTVISLNGLVNPSGMEIAAAVLLWTALTRLFTASDTDDEPATHRLVLLCGVGVTTLALLRPAGLAVLALVVVLAAVALGDRTRIRALLRRPDVRRVAIVTGAAAVVVVGWSLAAGVWSVGTDAPADERPWSAVIRGIVMSQFDHWVRQMIGLFGYSSVYLPVWTVALWSAGQGLLMVTGYALARRRHAYTIVAVPVLCLFIGFVVEVAAARVIGPFVQGRFLLPIWVGTFVLGAYAVPAVPERVTRRIYTVVTVVWSGAMVLGPYLTLRRYEFGRNVGVAGVDDPWTPAAGDIAPFVVTAAGIALVAWLVRRYLVTARDNGPAQPEPARAPVEAVS
jgi:hypothetical protein